MEPYEESIKTPEDSVPGEGHLRRVDSAGIDFRRDTRLALPKKPQRMVAPP